MSSNIREFRTRSAAQTAAVGADLGRRLRPGDVVTLFGELGSGKTVFVKGLCRALGVRDEVHSPTFTMVHEYEGRWPVIHVDLYRVHRSEELMSLGVEDWSRSGAVVLVEWAERATEWWPAHTIRVEIGWGKSMDERWIRIHGWPGDSG